MRYILNDLEIKFIKDFLDKEHVIVKQSGRVYLCSLESRIENNEFKGLYAIKPILIDPTYFTFLEERQLLMLDFNDQVVMSK